MKTTPDIATRLTRIALGHVTREYPHKLEHVLTSDADAMTPRALHPVFYGSFDWHSCVHTYWTLARLYRRFPNRAECADVRALFDTHLTLANVDIERTCMARSESRTFERPYGWAWLLMLARELIRIETPDGARWAAALAPLARDVAARFEAYLSLNTYPIRAGAHFNTAFACALALEFPDSRLRARIVERVTRWYGEDSAYQAWEPSGDDFLSPALMEAEVMRRALPAGQFRGWFGAFLPALGERRPDTLFAPAHVSDRSDGKIAHLDGLNLSRAWCWRNLASALGEPEAAVAREAAARHLESALPHVTGDYAGEHWLASFLLLALES